MARLKGRRFVAVSAAAATAVFALTAVPAANAQTKVNLTVWEAGGLFTSRPLTQR